MLAHSTSATFVGLAISALAVVLLVTAPSPAADIWGLKSHDDVALPSESPTHLFRFEDATSTFVDVGPVKVGVVSVDADALAQVTDRATGRLPVDSWPPRPGDGLADDHDRPEHGGGRTGRSGP